ncbi:hypothetical protein DESC_590123 [Desulfosarcina cetonica]|nr:hypothetical protein DESC_590123 [Desulfosarcina cetonica]
MSRPVGSADAEHGIAWPGMPSATGSRPPARRKQAGENGVDRSISWIPPGIGGDVFSGDGWGDAQRIRTPLRQS